MIDHQTDFAVCGRDANACTSQCLFPCGCQRFGRDGGLGRAAGRLYAKADGYPDAYKDAGHPARARHPDGDLAIFGARDFPPADNILGAKPGSAHGDSYRAISDFDGNETCDDVVHHRSLGHADWDIDTYAHTDGQTQPVRSEIAYASAGGSPDRQPAQRSCLGSTSDPARRSTDPCAGEARPGLLAVGRSEVV